MRTEGGAPVSLPDDDSIRRILLVRWSAMGDVTVASAGFEDVHRAFPGREIDLNTLPAWSPLFAADPRFRRVIAIDVRRRGATLCALRTWLAEVAAGRYDLVIDLQSTDRSRFMLGLLLLSGHRVRWRIGNRAVVPYNLAPARRPEPVHALQRIRDTLAAGGIPTLTDRPVLHVPEERRRAVRDLLAAIGVAPVRYVVLLPGSQAAGHLKRWGAARYARLARALLERDVDRVLIVGGPEEVEECGRIAAAGGPGAVDLCGRTELLDIVPLCEGARAVIANDTGTAHIAAAAGRPMFVICGPTDPRRVCPTGPAVVPLQAALACVNCYRKDCAHHTCMRLIEPERVATLVAAA